MLRMSTLGRVTAPAKSLEEERGAFIRKIRKKAKEAVD